MTTDRYTDRPETYTDRYTDRGYHRPQTAPYIGAVCALCIAGCGLWSVLCLACTAPMAARTFASPAGRVLSLGSSERGRYEPYFSTVFRPLRPPANDCLGNHLGAFAQ
jgi:hypothetical protein